MNYPITHVVVKNNPPPSHVVTIGHLYPIQQQRDPETIFRTLVPGEEDEEDIERWEDDGGAEEDETEIKVIKPRRGRRPKAVVAAETK